jgi:DNA-directed RNA polymerase subunit RPC12/RpoP
MNQQTALVACARCGVNADAEPPLEWITSVDDDRTTYYCGRCARENLRAIEARLDPEWW